VSVAHQHPDLHDLVDQLNPAQAEAVRAVVVEFVTPATDAEKASAELNDGGKPLRELAFVGAGASASGISGRIDELLRDGFGRD
jgi:N-acetylmuramic acid 6-phosphate (MurNAc-6-P) etherase